MVENPMQLLPLARIDDELIALIGITAGATIVLVWIIAATLDSVLKSKHREETRREIAAYVAEGSIAPSDAAAILNAGDDSVSKSIADGVAWGVIKAKDAERLMKAQRPPAQA
jgi:hypothetical protein